MILYGSFTSPYVRHCRIVLLESGLDFSFEDTDYAGSAAGSPTQRVPFLKDGDIKLTDSSSILLHIKQKIGTPFMQDIHELELYAMTNTAMDAAINLFLLEKDQLGPDQSDYLKRQAARIESSLAALNEFELAAEQPYSDGQIRLLCFLAWGLFRNRFNISSHQNLQKFLQGAQSWSAFTTTAPPA